MILTIQAALEKRLRQAYDINTRKVEYVETLNSLDVVFRDGDHSVIVHLPWSDGESMAPRYNLYLTGVNSVRRIGCVKALREVTPHLGLKDAKDICDDLHNGIKSSHLVSSYATIAAARLAAQPFIDAECLYCVETVGVP